MPYREVLRNLMKEHIVSGCLILDPYGNIFYHTGAFPQSGKKNLLDGYYILSTWVTYPQTVRIAGVLYNSVLNAYPDYWCLSNPMGHGSLVLQKCKNRYLFLCYLKDDDPIETKERIKDMSDLFG